MLNERKSGSTWAMLNMIDLQDGVDGVHQPRAEAVRRCGVTRFICVTMRYQRFDRPAADLLAERHIDEELSEES